MQFTEHTDQAGNPTIWHDLHGNRAMVAKFTPAGMTIDTAYETLVQYLLVGVLTADDDTIDAMAEVLTDEFLIEDTEAHATARRLLGTLVNHAVGEQQAVVVTG